MALFPSPNCELLAGFYPAWFPWGLAQDWQVVDYAQKTLMEWMVVSVDADAAVGGQRRKQLMSPGRRDVLREEGMCEPDLEA